jgi:N-acetylglucosamine malate deacetylase 1
MRLSDDLARVLVVAPHADDEVLGCGGLLARLHQRGCATHVIYLAVDGFHHYGYAEETTYPQRIAEIETVTQLLGFTYEIVYGDKQLIEKLDTVARRDVVDRLEGTLNERRPELLLLPSGNDYDQDHVATFQAGFAAARPIAEDFGKWLVPHVMTYESAKLNWAAEPLPRPAASCDITSHLETKLAAMRLYASQLRPTPHIRSIDAVKALAEIRGKEIGVHYAEAFGVLRTVI